MSKTLTSWISTAVCGRWFSSCSFSALITLKSRTSSVFVCCSKQFVHMPNEKRIYDCVTSYWLCELVRQHGGEELFDNLRTLSAAGRLWQVLQSLCGNAEESVGVLLWWEKSANALKPVMEEKENVIQPHTWWCLSSAARCCACSFHSPSSVPSGLSAVWTPEKHKQRDIYVLISCLNTTTTK